MTIRARLYLILMSIATVFIAALVYNYVEASKSANIAAITARAEGTADLIADLVLPCAAAKEDKRCWDKGRPYYYRIDRLAGFTVRDAGGAPLYRYSRQGKDALPDGPASGKGTVLETERTIADGDTVLGRLLVRMSMPGVDAQNENIVWRAVSAGTVFLALLGGALWAASSKLAGDMTMLVAAAERLEEPGMPSLPAAAPDSEVGRLSASFRTLHDNIAEEKHLRTESEELNRDFLAMTVHDLKQPITVIKAVNDLMIEAVDSGKYGKKEMGRISYLAKDSVERLNKMVEDILNITKLCDRNIPVQKEQVNVGGIVKSVIAEYSVVVERSGRRWSAEQPADIGQYYVYGDDVLIQRVIGNLVLNAIHYTPEGGEIRFEARLKGKDKIGLSVKDTGAGIPESFRTAIFEKYRSLSKTAKNVGLGLAFCKLVADRHSARLEVASTPGKGTEIAFVMPAARFGAQAKAAGAPASM